MKALSIRAPWWWFILHAGKDIENRDWATSYRGPLLIHASKWWRMDEVADDALSASHLRLAAGFAGPPAEITYRQMQSLGGYIVGRVDLVDCVSESRSPWFFGKFGFQLQNPVAFDLPVACKGALGLFEVPSVVTQALELEDLA